MFNLLISKELQSGLLIGGALLVLVVFAVINHRSAKKRQQEAQNMLDAIQPGNKVKTIGGICGIVVEVCDEDNSLVVETGSEKSGKSYIKFDKQAIYQTDAKTEEKPAVKEETPAPTEEVFEEVKKETEENVETKTEE